MDSQSDYSVSCVTEGFCGDVDRKMANTQSTLGTANLQPQVQRQILCSMEWDVNDLNRCIANYTVIICAVGHGEMLPVSRNVYIHAHALFN